MPAQLSNRTPGVRRSPSAGDLPEPLIGRVRAEYREMPGLCLTAAQASRLWQLDQATCTRILDVLIAERFLRRTAKGAFVAQDWDSPGSK
jgi:hypothetical protein